MTLLHGVVQVHDCAELCRKFLEDQPMDWHLALTLVKLQHRQQQQLVPAATEVPAPPLPIPSETSTFQDLLFRAQEYLVSEFEDFELVWSTAAGREQFLQLPFDAVLCVLAHPSLRVASENTVCSAAVMWLQHNGATAWALQQPLQQQQEQEEQQPNKHQQQEQQQQPQQQNKEQQQKGDEVVVGLGSADKLSEGMQVQSEQKQDQQQHEEGAGREQLGELLMSDVARPPTADNRRDQADLNPTAGKVQQQQQQLLSASADPPPPPAAAAGREQPPAKMPSVAADEPLAACSPATETRQQPQQLLSASHSATAVAGAARAAAGHQGSVTTSMSPSPHTAFQDLLGVLRIPCLSYTYLLHVLPALPGFQQQPQLVGKLQREALVFKAAGPARQQRICFEARSAAAGASRSVAAAAGVAAPPPCRGGSSSSVSSSSSSEVAEVEATSQGSIGAADGPMSAPPPPPAAAAAASGPFASSLSSSRAARGSCTGVTRYTPRLESLGDGYQFRFSFHPTALAKQQPGGLLATRLLPMHQQAACVVSEDHWYSGLVWNLIVARDGFVGLTWRVPADAKGKQSVKVAPGPGGVAEVGVAFSIWVEEEHALEDNSNYSASNHSSNNLLSTGGMSRWGFTAKEAAAAPGVGGGGGERALQHKGVQGAVAGGSPSRVTRKQQQTQTQGSGKRSAARSLGSRYERVYRDPQFIAADCAWGFAQFLKQGPGVHAESLDPDSRITLGCRVKLCD